MDNKINPFPLEYVEVNNSKKHFKYISYVLIFIFTFNPLYEIIDVFSKEFFYGWCCMLPCQGLYDSYFFL